MSTAMDFNTSSLVPQDVDSDWGMQFALGSGMEFYRLLGALTSLFSIGFHPEINGQTERYNQEMDIALGCITSQNPSSWSRHHPCVEYAHNSLPMASPHSSVSTSINLHSSMHWRSGYSSLGHALLCHYHLIWRKAQAAILSTKVGYQRSANSRRTPTPLNQVGQKVWFSTQIC